MKKPAMSSLAASNSSAASHDSASVCTSPTSPTSTILPVENGAQNVATLDDSSGGGEEDEGQTNYHVKQLKTKVTERVKRIKGKPDSIVWDVRVGVALFNVYRTPIGDREMFTLSYWLNGKRHRQVLPTLNGAIEAAKQKGKQLAKGDVVEVEMSPADRASAAKVLGWLKPLGLSLELVVSEYLDARKRLGPVTLSRCVDAATLRSLDISEVMDVTERHANEVAQINDLLPGRFLMDGSEVEKISTPGPVRVQRLEKLACVGIGEQVGRIGGPFHPQPDPAMKPNDFPVADLLGINREDSLVNGACDDLFACNQPGSFERVSHCWARRNWCATASCRALIMAVGSPARLPSRPATL